MSKKTAPTSPAETAHLAGDDFAADLPVHSGTLGPRVVDVRSLYRQTGMFTYDPGYTSTASCESKITFIDGEKGELFYRGYPIEQLAEESDFMEVSYLLLHGELPSQAEREKFIHDITYHTMVHEQISHFYRGFRRDAHPMAVMVGVVGALAAFYHDSTDISDPRQRQIASYRMIAKMPTIAAMAYKYSVGQPFVYPRNDLSYAANFLHMMFAVPCEEYHVSPTLERAMDLIFTLHADHEQNASTSTVRLAGSSGANPFACIAAGCACLWGPAHGGANEAALKMLAEIGTPDRIPHSTVLSVDQAGSNASFFGSLALLPGNETVLVEQNDWSEERNINPYAVFDKPPAMLQITPNLGRRGQTGIAVTGINFTRPVGSAPPSPFRPTPATATASWRWPTASTRPGPACRSTIRWSLPASSASSRTASSACPWCRWSGAPKPSSCPVTRWPRPSASPKTR